MKTVLIWKILWTLSKGVEYPLNLFYPYTALKSSEVPRSTEKIDQQNKFHNWVVAYVSIVAGDETCQQKDSFF